MKFDGDEEYKDPADTELEPLADDEDEFLDDDLVLGDDLIDDDIPLKDDDDELDAFDAQ